MEYGKFLRINYRLHQVCSSYFVTTDWSSQLRNSWIADVYPFYGFPNYGESQFQGLASFCLFLNNTINNSLTDLYSTRYVDMYVPHIDFFHSQILALVDAFKSCSKRQFLTSLKVVRETAQADGFISALGTNVYMDILPGDSCATIGPQIFLKCVCFIDPTCTYPSLLLDSSTLTAVFLVTGFKVGCYVIEALLGSHLGCFYNSTCLGQLISFLSRSVVTVNDVVLDSSVASRFNTTTTGGELVE